MKIAIIGGSFDPIHNGHLAMARYVLHHHLAQQVWFMVSKHTPLKKRSLTFFEDRVRLVRIATAHDARMKVCRLEAMREGLSYTIDTVKECQRRWPQHEFVWLIGNDQAAQLDAWKDIDELSKRIEFYVFPREQAAITCAYPHKAMGMELLDVSSSEIRAGKKLWQLPKAVYREIMREGYYMDTMVRSQMSEKRFLHSKSVATLCFELAACHGLDCEAAFQAGMYHDICKEWGKQRLYPWMAALERAHLEESPAIWHGYVAAHIIHKYYGIRNKEVRFAIYHHVQGSDRSKLAMVLYIADKLDPLRGYDSTETLALCRKDLRAGYHKVKQEQAQYLKKELGFNHGRTAENDRTGD